MSLGAVVGACILALHSFSLQAEEDGDAAFSPMTGATLSALHAAIPAAADEDEPAPTF